MTWFSLHISLHHWFLAEDVTHTLVCAACDVLLGFFFNESSYLTLNNCKLVVHVTRLYMNTVGLYSEKFVSVKETHQTYA